MEIVERNWNGSPTGRIVTDAEFTRHSAHLAIAPIADRRTYWGIYHVPSGCIVFSVRGKRTVIDAVAEIAGLTDWSKRAIVLRHEKDLPRKVYQVSLRFR